MANNVPDYMKKVVGWDKTTTRLGETQKEFPHLEGHRIQLEVISQEYKGVSDEYALASATKLELSEKMRLLLRKGETLVHFLRTGIRQHYGVDSEKLFAYGIVPTTRRARPAKPPVEQAAAPVPAPDSVK